MKKYLAIAGVTASVLLLGGSVVLAQMSLAPDWMSACVTTSGNPAKNIGQLRVIGPGEGCEENEEEVTIALGDHNHDGRYFTEAELSNSGAGGQVHWDNLLGVPADLADGDDGDITLVPTTHYYSIVTSAFRPALSETDYYSTGSRLRGTTALQQAWFDAPIYLPDGATITHIKALIRDSSGDYDITVGLFYALTGEFDKGNGILSLSSSGTPGESVLESDMNLTVDNLNHAYSVRAVWDAPPNPADLSLGTVVITYETLDPQP